MKTLIIFILTFCFMFSQNIYAKNFIRDYTYRASDDDSKNIARSNAIEQVKILLLEEIGVYIQSYVEIEKSTKNQNTSSFLSHEIKTTTAGITKTKIISEKWNGKEYKLRASINIDVEDVIKKINETITQRANSKNISELNELLKQKDKRIQTLSATLQNRKSELGGQQIRLNNLKSELSALKIKLQKNKKEEKYIKTEVERIKYRISKATSKAKEFTTGMTKKDLQRIAGAAYSEDSFAGNTFLNYGKYWAYLPSGVFLRLIPISEYSGAGGRY